MLQQDYNREYYALKNKFDEDIKNLRKIYKEKAALCKHEDLEYFPDASGNNDSTYECRACGFEIIKHRELTGIKLIASVW